MKNIKRIALFTLCWLFCAQVFAVVPQSLKQLKGDSQTIMERIIQQKSSRNQVFMKADNNVEPDARTQAFTWGTLGHEDGTTWYFSQSFVERQWYLDSSEIVIFDNNFEEVGRLNVVVPEELNVNDIAPVYFMTSQFFDTDASTLEIPVFVHAVDNGNQINKIYVYNLGGEKLQEYDSRSMIYFTADNDYRRMVLVNEVNGEMLIDIMAPAQEQSLPSIEHQFVIDQDLLYYNDGPALSYYTLDGEPFYSTAHFEKPCMDGMDMETYIPTQAPDNYLVIKTYNKEYEQLDSLKVSIDPTNEDATYGFASLSMLSYNDVRLGEFTGDDQRNYIVAHYEYFAQSDEFTYHFKVYDESGNLVKTIVENAMSWFEVSDVEGYEEQIAFMKLNTETASQVIEMINIPSCEVSTTLPAVIDGQRITTYIDRYPVGDDYQYVIGLSQAEVNKDGDAIARIGWYKRDCSLDHYVEFNLGKNAEGFTPYIASYVLDPYLFNTDDKHEYFYLAMNKRTDGSDILDKTLYLADENGNVLRTMKPEDSDEVEFSSGDVFDYHTASPKMVLSFYDGEKDAFDIQFYNLPFDKFTSGGNGSEENPYVITTPGELAQMCNMPAESYYVLGNDIDMGQYSRPYEAPVEFAGVFDGNNYIINNIILNETGIFGSLHHAIIKNLQLQSPVLNIYDNIADMGIVANCALQSTIENVHIYDADICADYANTNFVGGMIGCAIESEINAVSVLRAENMQQINNLGGIVGSLNKSCVNAAVATGEMMFTQKFGGIASFVSLESKISNAHTDFDLLLPQMSGGIAAVAEGSIEYCYTTSSAYGELDENEYPNYDYAAIAYNGNADAIVSCVEVTSGEEMTRSFFEGLGYTYGNTVDAPWCGEGLPILYFENEYNSTPTIEMIDNSIVYNGTTIVANDAQRIALYNMQGVLVVATDQSILNVDNVANGIYVVVATNAQGEQMARKVVIR